MLLGQHASDDVECIEAAPGPTALQGLGELPGGQVDHLDLAVGGVQDYVFETDGLKGAVLSRS